MQKRDIPSYTPVTHNRSKGNSGEEIACIALQNKGFTVICRNYQKVWGELDIVALKDDVLNFFEVKSVCVSRDDPQRVGISGTYKPEDNVHGFKVRQIRRMIETYLMESGKSRDTEFYFHIVCVYMNMQTRRARVKLIEHVIL